MVRACAAHTPTLALLIPLVPPAPECTILKLLQYPSDRTRGEYIKGSAIGFLALVAVSLLLMCVFPSSDEEAEIVWTQALIADEVITSALLGVLQVAGSIGLFAMALAESRGEEVELVQFWQPLKKPWQWVWIGLSAGIASAAAWIVSWQFLDGWWIWVIYYALLLITAPFYILVLPHMLATGQTYGEAVKFNLAQGTRSYPALLKMTSLAVLRGWWGILLCGIGNIWTQPQYQRTIAKWYAEHFLNGWRPTPPTQQETEPPPHQLHGFTQI